MRSADPLTALGGSVGRKRGTRGVDPNKFGRFMEDYAIFDPDRVDGFRRQHQ